MKRYLLYTFIFTLLALPKQAFAQCDLPSNDPINTGSNMTVFLSPALINSLPITTPGSYIIALTPDALVVGKGVVSGVTQTAFPVWGDDSQTTEVDGAGNGETISFQLVDGEILYDVEMPTETSYTLNLTTPQLAAATVTLNCEPPVLGCIDDQACNYDEDANQDDASCTYAEANKDCNGVCINDTDEDGICNEAEIDGCTDAAACNFDNTATEDDASCLFAVANKDCNGNCINDADIDGVCDEDEIQGCTDATACNFDATATDEDGSCSSAEANKDCNGNCINDADNDGTCDEDEEGVCTDEIACNYTDTPNAITDNTLCDYADAESCEECVDGVSVVTLDSDGDGVCDADEIDGCTDAAACNFDNTATEDDASCLPALKDCETCSTDEDGNSITDGTGTILENDDDDDGICNDAEVAGCTDPLSSNYDDLATDDDGSCNVLGCTNSDACNYNEEANQDNGFCVFAGDCQSCSGDTDGTGVLVDDVSTNTNESSAAFCDEIYTEAEQGSFSVGYKMNFSTVGTNVIVNFELLDNKDGVIAYLWGMNPNFSETSMTTTGDKQFTKTFSNQAIGSTITYACKFAFAGGMAVTKYFDYTVGEVFCGSAPVCDNKTIPGCNDTDACNFDASTNANDGSCTYEGPVYDCAGACLNDTDGDAVCDENEILGCNLLEAENYDETATENDDSCIVKACADASACNFNVNATEDDGSCSYPLANYDCEGTCLNDADADGVCDEDEIAGCMDITRCNYNASATDDEGCLLALDGICETCSLDGDGNPFTDGTGKIVDNDINDNGVCDENEAGCTRPNADNYNPDAISNDGSCLYGGAADCIIPSASVTNTGSNMTVFFSLDFVNSLSIDTRKSSLIALTPDGQTVGSELVTSTAPVQMAIMADDATTTDEIDGALEGDSISFKLLQVYDKEFVMYKNDSVVTLYDTLYYDLEIPNPLSFEINGYEAQTSAAGVNLNCTRVLGCNDPNADNYNDYDGDGEPNPITGNPRLDITANFIGSCKYSPCAALVATDFAIEFDADITKSVLTYKIKNTLSDQDFLTPDFELVLYSNTFEFLDTTYYSGSTITRNGSQTISIPLYNDFTEYIIPDSLSGNVRVSGSGSIDSLSVVCDVAFDNVSINIDQVGCKEKDAYNYSELVTIDNGMCFEDLSVTIDKEDPTCSYDYGSAIIHVTGDSRSVLSSFSSDSLYNWTAESGAITMQDSIRFVDGYAYLEGLDEGEYIIGIKDSVVVKTDTFVVFSLDTLTIIKPEPIEVEIVKRDSLVYSVNQDEIVFQQWLFKGVPLQQDKFKVHYPQNKGLYQVYVENEEGCGYYSESVLVLTLDVEDLGEDLFHLYPNPTESTINLGLANLDGDATVVLTDVLGQELHHLLVKAGASHSNYSFDVSEFPSGLYFVRVNQGRNQLVKRFVKK